MDDWQASDGHTTHSFSADALRYRKFMDELLGITTPPKKEIPKWISIEEMNAALKNIKSVQRPKYTDKASRIKQIEQELDIIRGRVPTPKGYTIDPIRAKRLMIELKQLS